MWNDDDHFVQPEVQAQDMARLAELTAKAEEIKAKVLELKKGLVAEFMEFSESQLGKYEYCSAINNAVYEFQNTLNIYEYEDGIDFWLPSNIGC
jgi:hypothetical protein